MRGRMQLLSVSEIKQGLNYSFKEFIKLVDEGKAESLESCGKSAYTHNCNHCGHEVLIRTGCNERRICPVCNQAMRLRQSEKAMDLFGKIERVFGGLRFIHQEGTIPKRYWNRFDDFNINELGKVMWRVVKECFREMYGNDLVFAGVYSVHYWHSKDAFVGWYPHVHCTIPSIAFDREKGEFVRFKGHIDQKLFRTVWTREVSRVFGFDYDDRLFNFHSQHTGINKLRHRLSYMFRSPLADVYKWFKHGGSFDIKSLDWSKRMLLGRVNLKKYQFCGFLFERVKKKYLDLMNVVNTSMKDFIVEVQDKRLACLQCKKGKYVKVEGKPAVLLDDLDDDAVVLVFSAKAGKLRSSW